MHAEVATDAAIGDWLAQVTGRPLPNINQGFPTDFDVLVCQLKPCGNRCFECAAAGIVHMGVGRTTAPLDVDYITVGIFVEPFRIAVIVVAVLVNAHLVILRHEGLAERAFGVALDVNRPGRR